VTIKIFISHQRTDSMLATRIAERLRVQHQLDCYLDVIDTALTESGQALADYVRAQLSKCTQLLAVVSPATRESWWVPWEIGVATEKNFPLATYSGSFSRLPEFLHKWPVLKTDADLDQYAAASKAYQRQYQEQRRVVVEAAAQRSAAAEFYHTLRGQIG